MIDLDRCIGCKSCEAACKQEHGLGPHEYRNKVLWLERSDIPKVDLLTVTCQHCERPACLRACPVNPKAIAKDPVTGVVSVNEDRCTGCGECVVACPYGAMGFDAVDQHAVKCDLCADRRGRGERPACASVCPAHAIHFGERETLLANADDTERTRLDHDHFLMGPATIYLQGPEQPDAQSRLVQLIADQSSRQVLTEETVTAPYRVPREQRLAERVVPGTCNICFNSCPIKFHLKGNQVVGITGNDEDPVFQGKICPKSQMTLQLYNNKRRLTQPLKRIGNKGDGRFEAISWSQALDEIAEKLKKLRDQHGPETLSIFSGTRSGIITNRGYVRLFGQMWGTPNIDSTEPFCSAGKTLSYGLVQGDKAIANSYTPNDIGSAGLYVYIGDNQAETRPVYFGMVNQWRKRSGSGARMIVVDPRLSATANKADLWLPIRSGTDMALGLALIQHIFANDLHDQDYCEHWIEGWQQWRDFIQDKGYTPQWAESITDIPQQQIEQLGEDIAKADGCMIFASRGLNQHTNSMQTNRIFMFLAAITGNWGRRGGGYFNMSTPQAITPNAPAERRTKITRPSVSGSPTGWLNAMTNAEPYPVTALIAANNPFSNWPGQQAVREALQALPLFVHLALFRNATSDFADYVLPIATGIEKGGISRSADERRIVWNDQMIDPPGEAKTDGWIWIELGKRLGFDDVLKEEYKDIAVFWDEVCKDNDNLRGCTVARFRQQPTRTLRTPAPSEDSPAIETLYLEDNLNKRNRFPTTSGKLEFWTEQQEKNFALLGLSALPEFYSEREQLIDLPYVESSENSDVITPFLDKPAYGRPSKIIDQFDNNSPGAKLREQGFDTELITGRPPASHFHSWTHDFWQAQEMWPDLYVQMHPTKAQQLGIGDGDRVSIETSSGKIEARAWIRQGIRPTAVFVPIGWDEKQPYNPWRPVNYLSDYQQRDPIAEQTNLKTRLCKLARVR